MSTPDTKTTIESLVTRYRREAARSDGSSSPELEIRFQNVDYDNFAAIYSALSARRTSDGAAVPCNKPACGILAIGDGALSQTVSVSMEEQGRSEAVRSDGRRPLHATRLRVISFVDGVKTGDVHSRKEALMFPLSVPNASGLTYKVALASEGAARGVINDQSSVIRVKARVSFPLTLTGVGGSADRRPELLWRIDLTVTRQFPGSSKDDTKNIRDQMFRTSPPMTPANFLIALRLDGGTDVDAAARRLYQYEVEVEFLGPKAHQDLVQPADVFAAAETVLRLANPERLREAALQAEVFRAAGYLYAGNPSLLARYRHERGLKQLLPQAEALTRAEYRKLFPPRGFFVTDKTDGKRALGIAHEGKGRIASDTLLETERTGASTGAGTTILDGELVETQGPQGVVAAFYAFDAIAINGVDVTQVSFEERLPHLETGVKHLQAAGVPAYAKDIHRIQGDSAAELERAFLEAHETPRPYRKDGIIIIEPGEPYMETTSYKWKSAEDNTIDCFVRRAPASVLGKEPFLDKPGHLLHFLFVTISPELYSALGLQRCPGYADLFPDKRGPDSDTNDNFPIQFSPGDAPLAYLYWHSVQTGAYGIPAEVDGKVLELRCVGGCIAAGEGGFACWEAVRVREDRKRELASGRYFGNNYKTAEMVWLNYLEPFPLRELWEGPGADYFMRDKSGVYRAQTAVISFVKSRLIGTLKHEGWVVDIGVGKGQDLGRYFDAEVQNLVAVDSDRAALSELVRRKYTLVEKRRRKGNRGRAPKVNWHPRVTNISTTSTTVYVLAADASAPFRDTIKLFQRVGVPSGLANELLADALVCNLAVHYFLSDPNAVRNFVALARHTVKIRGRVVLTVFLGEAVHALFKANKVPVGGSWDVIEQESRKYSIKRLYSSDKLEAAGQRIGVQHPFSNGEYYEENLVNVAALTKAFKDGQFILESSIKVVDSLADFENVNPALSRFLTPGDKEYLALYGALVFVRKS
jgi:hypothetical protein